MTISLKQGNPATIHHPVIASAAWQSTNRHCERSVAIHAFVRRLSWIASFLAMTGLERDDGTEVQSEAIHRPSLRAQRGNLCLRATAVMDRFVPRDDGTGAR
jgi:hypothetical protein